ncbi:MAG: D-alanyl-D-alanine carboxypeptidase, partial [Pseudomonadales bacterium]|nr:D-alanyl-D-alanine carboxypeptidase [Pseudomonadales bacterium]
MSASRFVLVPLLLLLVVPAAVRGEASVVPEALPPSVLRVAGALGVDPQNVSVFVADLADGAVRAHWRADAPRIPASTLKLVTTFAALEGLTPAHRWRTEAWALGPVRDGVLDGDLLLRGTGDPWLVAEEFWKFVRGIRGAGIRRITGDLVVDGSAF